MIEQDIRWQQRFNNYRKALAQLEKFTQQKLLNELEEQGLIQAFEYTHELAWKTLSDFLKFQGNSELYGSKDVTRESFSIGLIENGEIWMSMIQSRNMTFYTYNEETAQKIVNAIKGNYFGAFKSLEKKLEKLVK